MSDAGFSLPLTACPRCGYVDITTACRFCGVSKLRPSDKTVGRYMEMMLSPEVDFDEIAALEMRYPWLAANRAALRSKAWALHQEALDYFNEHARGEDWRRIEAEERERVSDDLRREP